MKPFDEQAALWFNAFEGDETDVTLLADRIVTAAKDHAHCHMCDGPIRAGERHRSMREKDNESGEFWHHRWCSICCRAMARQCENGPYRDFSPIERLVESRDRIGHARRLRRGPTP